MRTASIRVGDIVHVNRGGRLFHAEVTALPQTDGMPLEIMPLARNHISYRTCKAREVMKVWRASRARV